MARTQVGSRAKRGFGSRLGGVLLTLAAIGGVVCIVLVILAVAFHITLILFKTGSMTPAIPQGSLALVREIPASEVKVGDVVTVTRPDDQLPISHRVVSIAKGDGAQRILTLRGDANPVPDPAPYVVTTVRLVFWSVPGLAYVVVWFANPLVLGALAVGVAALVTWAFWPASPSRSPRKPRRGDRAASRLGDQTSTLVAALVLGGAAAAWVTLPAQQAHAAAAEQVITGKVITLTSVGDLAAMADLTPGVPTLWQVGVSSHTSESGTIAISLRASGPLASDDAGLAIQVSGCNTRWVNGTCASGERLLIAQQPAAQLGGVARTLGRVSTRAERWIQVTASVPDVASERSGTSNVRITASGMGDSQVAAPGAGAGAGSGSGPLAFTGANAAPSFATAIGSVLAGLALAGAAAALRRRRRAGELA